jgi:hypothetical protein
METTPCPYTFFAGLDAHWGDVKVRLVDAAKEPVGRRVFPADQAGVAALVDWLDTQVGARRDALALAVERPDGPVSEALVGAGLNVYSINPKQARLYGRFCNVAEAKDDDRDALQLAKAAASHLECFTLVTPDPPLVVRLRELTRTHEDLRAAENQWANRLREALHNYFPALLKLASPNLLDPFVWELLERWPTPALAAAASPEEIADLLKRHRIRRWSPDQVVAALRADPPALLPGRADTYGRTIQPVVAVLRTVCTERVALHREIGVALADLGATLATPADPGVVALALSNRGLGVLTCARLCGEAWRFLSTLDLAAMRRRGGCAPVTETSGKSGAIHQRWACNPHLRRALHDWARGAVAHDPLAKAHFQELRARGCTVERALRGVVDRLLAVLFAMLRDRTRYDPTRRKRYTQTAQDRPQEA